MTPYRMEADDDHEGPPLPRLGEGDDLHRLPAPGPDPVEPHLRRERRSRLHEEAQRLAQETYDRQEARRAAGMPDGFQAPGAHCQPRMSGLTRYCIAVERERAEKEAQEEERRAYRRALYRWEKARKAGLTDEPAPLSPAAARKEAQRVAKEAQRERWKSFLEERGEVWRA